MRKEEYTRFIDPKEFSDLYNEWAAAGKPTGNDPLYLKIWNGVENAVKACVGAIQARYRCKYQDYDEKVLDGTAKIVAKLLKMEEVPKNIVSMCYLPVLGVVAGPKAMQSDFENNMASLDIPIEGRIPADSITNY